MPWNPYLLPAAQNGPPLPIDSRILLKSSSPEHQQLAQHDVPENQCMHSIMDWVSGFGQVVVWEKIGGVERVDLKHRAESVRRKLC